MALHVVGLPWTELTREWESEAFTARTRVLASMLAKYGKVYVYGGERHETVGTEYVQIVDRRWQARHWPGYKTTDVFADYDPSRAPWIEWNVLAAKAIRERAHPGDTLGITMGISQELIANLLADLRLTVVEVGIGYKGVIPDRWNEAAKVFEPASHKVFESKAWQTWHAGHRVGMQTARGDGNADVYGDQRNFDAAIPRAYETEDFPEGPGTGGYFVFMGRIVARKGVMIAAQVCQRLGAKLMLAGQNVTEAKPGRVVTSDGSVLDGDVQWVGVIGPEERAALLGGAVACFTPTLYMEPFGGVHAESLLTGTPVIASDWGCFPEYVNNGNGYTCNTLAEFVTAAKNVGSLDRRAIRSRAIATYSTDAVGPQYDAYLQRLSTLRREGWYELPPLAA